jgi:hypothetical protein
MAETSVAGVPDGDRFDLGLGDKQAVAAVDTSQ